jgi:NAD(P)H-dependent FMN reductase
MKILAINGSHRGPQGYTAFLLDKIAKGAREAGAEFEIVTLAKIKINRCLSCGQCNSPDHYLKCVYDEKDDVREVFNKMAAADLLIFASPVYVFQMTGLMKIFLERLYATADVFDLRMTKSGLFFHHIDPEICSKPLAALICCDNIEKGTPQGLKDFFRTYARFHDAPLVGLLVRNAGRFAGHGQDPNAAQRAPKLPLVYGAFEQAGRELATQGRINKATEKAACQDIIPMPPIFNLLKNFRPFKKRMVEKARAMSQYVEGEV